MIVTVSGKLFYAAPIQNVLQRLWAEIEVTIEY